MKTVYRHSIDGKLSPLWGEQLRSGINSRGPLRVQEETNSARVVGVDNVEFLDHLDGVIEGGLPLRRDIALAIRRHRPDVVITMSYEDGPRGPAWAIPAKKILMEPYRLDREIEDTCTFRLDDATGSLIE